MLKVHHRLLLLLDNLVLVVMELAQLTQVQVETRTQQVTVLPLKLQCQQVRTVQLAQVQLQELQHFLELSAVLTWLRQKFLRHQQSLLLRSHQ